MIKVTGNTYQAMNEKKYDELFNEGAEGFNPYRHQKDSEPIWSKVENRISKLQRLLNGMSDSDFRDRERYLAEIEELKKVYEEIKSF